MISINNALELILSNTKLLGSIQLNIDEALNYYLAEDVFATMQIPPFSQSAMDGYAVSGEHPEYSLVGEIKAGDTESIALKDGEAVRIFTGAKIPAETTLVAQQEIVDRKNESIIINKKLKQNANIRFKGEELRIGDTVMIKGTLINASAVGLLGSLGILQVKVYAKPKIALLVTGNELVKQGTKLKEGQIYESNSLTLSAALKSLNLNVAVDYIEDNYMATKNKIENLISSNDLVLMTGGISVGDYDFVGKALEELQVEEVFYKVNQKPGKPLYYGLYKDTKVFALPGNPAAALTCFYMYVLTAIKQFMGSLSPVLIENDGLMEHDFVKKGGRALLLKATFNNGKVKIHQGQSSAMMSSFVSANCLLFVPAESDNLILGDKVKVYMLP